MNIPPVIKTGFDLTIDDSAEKEKDIISMIALFTKNALRTSAIYTKHSQRNTVTVEDIKRALMMEVFVFMKRPDVIEETKKIKEELFDYQEEEDDENIEVYSDPDDLFCESDCTCGLCVFLNKVTDKWSTWEPKSQFEKILYKHINNIH